MFINDPICKHQKACCAPCMCCTHSCTPTHTRIYAPWPSAGHLLRQRSAEGQTSKPAGIREARGGERVKRRSGGFRNARSTNSWFCCFGLVCLFVCQKYVTLVAGHMTGWTIDDIKKDTTWRRVTKEERQRNDMAVAQAVTSTWTMVDSGSEESSSPISLDRPPKAAAAASPVRRAQGAGRIRQATCASCIACCAPFLVLYSHLHPDTHTHIQALASRFDKTMHAAGFQRASTLERSPTQVADDEVDRLHRQLAAAKARAAALKKKVVAEKESFSDWKTVPLRMPSPPPALGAQQVQRGGVRAPPHGFPGQDARGRGLHGLRRVRRQH